MQLEESLKRVSELATRQYQELADDRLFFHNMSHTLRLLDAVSKMSIHFNLEENNGFIVRAAAWLYDLEIISGNTGSRALTGTGNAETLLKSAGIDDEFIREIKNCLLAVCSEAIPESLNEKILSDAYYFYLGSPRFIHYQQLLRKEIEAFTGEKIKGNVWRAQSISRLEAHHYHTAYGQSLLEKTKSINAQNLKKIQEEKHGHFIQGPENKLSVKHRGGYPAWKNKSRHHLSGVETVFRNSSSNHLNLSVMADNKAFIMISVNSILISVGIGLIIGKFVLIPKLFIPTVLLLTVNVVTIIYSVLATRPGLMKGTFTREGVGNKTVDLLFFGNFFKMPLADFEYGMRKMMDDDDFLYGNLIRDIHSQGKNLGRKFRLLRTSYNLFMYGTACTVIAYVLSFFL